MRSISTYLLVLGFSFAVAYYYPHVTTSPGGVQPHHAKLEQDCTKCHTGFKGIENSNCLSCHPLIGIGKKDNRNLGVKEYQNDAFLKGVSISVFHQELGPSPCYSCHPEHSANRLAQRTRFNHKFLKDSTESCQNCHTKPTDTFHRKTVKGCEACHGTTSWKSSKMDHSRFFRFSEEHPGKCSNCHVDGNYSTYTCYGCHEHSQSEVDRKHIRMGLKNYTNCTACHRSASEREASENWGKLINRRDGQNLYDPTVTHSTESGRWKKSGNGEGRDHDDDDDDDEEDDDD